MRLRIRGREPSPRKLLTLFRWVTLDLLRTIRMLPFLPSYRKAIQLAARNSDFALLFRWSQSLFGTIQNPEELSRFLGYLQAERPVRIVEIGVYRGGTAFLFCLLVPSVELYIGIDLFVRSRVAFHYLCRDSARLHFIDSVSTDRYARAKLEGILGGQPVDFLFIDGDHSYDGVKSDFEQFRPFVRDGGIVAFHDVNPSPAGHSGGVPEFWARVRPLYDTTEFIDFPGKGAGVGVLRYKAAVETSGHL
jgi:predicted O-methyltransferase YrrM